MKPFSQKEMKPWGYEVILAPPEAPASAKILHVNQGHRSSLQYHEIKEETLILIDGKAYLIYGPDKDNLTKVEMKPFKGYFIPKGLVHRYGGITDCDIFESSLKEDGTTYRLEDDYHRPNETKESGEEERKKNLVKE